MGNINTARRQLLLAVLFFILVAAGGRGVGDRGIACLKRVRPSVEKWQKQLGRRGYFDFVEQFFP